MDHHYALGQNFGAEGPCVPQVDGAVTAGRHQIVLRGAKGQRVYTVLVGSKGLED